MRLLKSLVTAMILVPTLSQAFGEMRGTVLLRLDNNSQRTEKLNVKLKVDSEKRAAFSIQSEGTMVGTLNDTKVTAVQKTPKRFAYYELDLSPKLVAFNGKALIELNQAGREASVCDENSNALLTSYQIDGTSTQSCVTFL